MKLHTVTCLEDEHSTRYSIMVVCTSRESAREIVERNCTDIHENNHEYAVIAVISADSSYGLRSVEDDADSEEIWYRWQGTTRAGRYVECEKPPALLRVVYGL